MNSVTTGLGADVKHRIADAGGLAEKDLIVPHETKRERIHERIERVSIIERDFAADGRHAKRVAVMRNASDHASEQRSISRPYFA